MTSAPPIPIESIAPWHAQQSECPVIGTFSLDYLAGLGSMEVARERLLQREEAIENLTRYPLTHCWEPDIWREIDLEVARKRLAHPGRVLEVFITGGMRPGKSFSCARRQVAHWCYTPNAMVFALAETLATSRKLQQQPIERFLPEEVSPMSGKFKTTKHERFKFSGGHFTNEEFSLRVPVEDENGRTFLGGGDFVFRFFSQEIGTFQGYELTSAWSDELVPLTHVKAVRERMATRATETRKPEFLHRIAQAVKILESGQRLPVTLLGALYHGVHLISFTPYLGWNETVNYFLNGARKYGWITAPDLVGKPGVTDARVPRFAQPPHETGLVAYIHTADNKIKPAYEELSAALKTAPESEVRIKLYGDVDRDQAAVFRSFGEHHLCDWKDISRTGTIYEIIDPAKVRPAAVIWVLVDGMERLWQLQEWPCESIHIQGRLPGAWAVPSEKGRFNGDEGPAYRLPLNWKIARMVFEIHAMRKRIIDQFAASGAKFAGEVFTGTMEWSHPFPDGAQKLEGTFIKMDDRRTLLDPRGGEERLDGQTVRDCYDGCEHGIASRLDPPAIDDADGVALIKEYLNGSSSGLPRVQINRECTNTIFMFTNYTIPPFKEGPQRKDEVCAEWFDLWKYLLKTRPAHVDERAYEPERGGVY